MRKTFFNFLDKYKITILYSVLLLASFVLIAAIFSKPDTRSFFSALEAKTFDLRQVVISDKKKVNKNIVIVAIDDASYEYLTDKYGDWPVPREIYADFINYIQNEKPAFIVFDLQFFKSLKSKPKSDKALSDAIGKYNNVYTAIMFDEQPFDVRKPAILPDYLKADLDIKSKNLKVPFVPNCRAILSSIINSTHNIGHIFTPRATDGISRTVPLFIKYPHYNQYQMKRGLYKYDKVDYYPYMTLKVATSYLNKTENQHIDKFIIDKNNNLLLGNRKIPMQQDGEVILNWYGQSGETSKKTFTYVPFWKIIQDAENQKLNKKPLIDRNFFKDKIVYVGTSVPALADIKTVPTERYLPGVELHATLLNNILDNCIIKKLDFHWNILITLSLALIIAVMVLSTSSTLISSVASIIVIIGYLFLSAYLMQYFNLWIWTVMPVIASILSFILVYLVKYIIKSRDFEHTYKLATTDGLTELYNHRFFQEQMLLTIETCKRANTKFSLILIDIDFFKKFNDTYGHQSGDAVLRQVAQTLKKAVRASDIVCRYGGEEMSIILKDVGVEESVITAQKLCDTIASKTFRLVGDLEKNVTISLGVATFPENGETSAELIEHADKGLYLAKENGRNQVGIAK